MLWMIWLHHQHLQSPKSSPRLPRNPKPTGGWTSPMRLDQMSQLRLKNPRSRVLEILGSIWRTLWVQTPTPNRTNLQCSPRTPQSPEVEDRLETLICWMSVAETTNLMEDEGERGTPATTLRAVLAINLKKLMPGRLRASPALLEWRCSERRPVTLLTRRRSSASRYKEVRIQRVVKASSLIPKFSANCSGRPKLHLHPPTQWPSLQNSTSSNCPSTAIFSLKDSSFL